MPGKAVVCGGSLGGLFAATALRAAGWDVALYERSPVELSGRGAGIVTHRELLDALTAVGASTGDLGVAVDERVAFDIDGGVVRRMDYPQVVTSWDRVYRVLREALPDGCHHLGRAASGYRETADGVELVFEDGRAEPADLLVGADGFRSAIRGQMAPDIQPAYSGYVVWRALASEADLPDAVHDAVFGAFGLFLPRGTQIVGYPIAGPENDLRPGHRRYNFVWYDKVAEADLTDMLTDETGRHHPVSIPPPLVRQEVLDRMMAHAADILPRPFVEVLKVSERPFFTPIYDHLSPNMCQGSVALSGDAACVARPHVGMGVTKAAEDALALARHVSSGTALPESLSAYSAERVAAARTAYLRSQYLGSLIFDAGPQGSNADGRSHPSVEFVMRQTAAVSDVIDERSVA